MEWKDAKKELPEIGDEVLLTDGKEIVSAIRLKNFGSGRSNWGGCGFSGYEWDFDVEMEKITHWMPLPDLPKKGGK